MRSDRRVQTVWRRLLTWNEDCEDCDKAFRDLKQAISAESILHSPDFEQPFTLQMDASGGGLWAVLLQEVEGDLKPVVFLSRKLLDQETRYSTIEKEGLAMKWAIDSLRYYLSGRQFILETDHRALQRLHKMKYAYCGVVPHLAAIQLHCQVLAREVQPGC